jgi:RES domain-containing protein
MAAGHIVEGVDGLPAGPLSGVAFRHQPVEWRYTNAGAGARTMGGRWNPPGSFATLYLGLALDVVDAEFRRFAKRSGRDPADFLPRHLLEYRVQFSDLLDLTDSQSLEALGMSYADLSGNDLRLCQEIGEAAHYLGREGVLSPSAAGNGAVVAVFLERVLPTSELSVISTTDWDGPRSTE